MKQRNTRVSKTCSFTQIVICNTSFCTQCKVISCEQQINTLCGRRTAQNPEAYPADGQSLWCTALRFLSAAVGNRIGGAPVLEHAALQVAF